MTQKTSKRTNKTNTFTPAPSLHGIFRRWLTAGLLGVAFYLTAGLVIGLSIKTSTNGSVSHSSDFIVSSLFVLAGLCALWWLIESAAGVMLYITRHSKPAPKKAIQKKKK